MIHLVALYLMRLQSIYNTTALNQINLPEIRSSCGRNILINP
jgi:hypothetical protein